MSEFRKVATIQISDVIKAAAKAGGVSRDEIVSSSRSWRLTRPRQAACYCARRLTGRSFPAIGRALGGRDHTTILFAFRKVARLREDPYWRALVVRISAAAIRNACERERMIDAIKGGKHGA